jgi:hypothetical protein
MNRREFIAALTTATVASRLVPALAVETELPLKTVEEINAEFAAHTQKMIDDGTVTLILTN